MQLSQPMQGDHPGSSGVSGLEQLMGDNTTVPPGRGVFLGVTRRMHPDVRRFISDAVYDGRLQSYDGAKCRRLILAPDVGQAVSATPGLRFVPMVHQECSQKCPEEVEQVALAYKDLLRCR
jgi:superfamily I DNA and/or RNA helicase